MPILREETNFYPDDLFSLSLETTPWQIVHVRSRYEKVVARTLIERQNPVYLPQIRKQTQRGGRTFTSHLPLFGGYVFLRKTDATRPALWSAGGVVRVISVTDQSLLDSELKQIRALEEAGAIFTARPSWAPGDVVRVTDGVFRGCTGTLLRQRDVLRIVVAITALNKSITAELPHESVAALSHRVSRTL